MKHVVITGVSRGIGLTMTELSLKRGDAVCGIARNPEESAELQDLRQKYKDQLIIVKGDVNDPRLSDVVKASLPWQAVDVVINNAGIYREDSWEDFEQTFLTNSIAPYFFTEGLFPLLRKSESAKAVFISSQMGSIADNQSGGSVSYRASKSALNMMVKCLSVDQPWLTSLIFHPGWVQTRMGGENAPTRPHESAEGLLKEIHASGKDQSGTFRNYQGAKLSW